MARTFVRAETQINNDWSAGNAWFLRTDGSTAMEGDLDLDSNKILNLTTPTAASDAANKAYVDSVATGLDVKRSVRLIQDTDVANLAAAAPDTVDGEAVSVGDRILLIGQTDASENGIYAVDTVGTGEDGSWSRAEDADTSEEVNAGMFMFITEGATYADSGWVLVTDDDIVLGTTDLEFTQFTGVGDIVAGDGIAKDGNEISVDLADESLYFNNGQLAVQLKSGGAIILDAVEGLELDFESAHFRVDTSGLELFNTNETAGQFAVSDATGAVSFVSMSGDATMDGTGAVTIQEHDGTIISEGDGLRLIRGDNGQLLIGQTGAAPEYKTLSGDATIDEEGVVTLTANFIEESDYIVRELPTGAINGVNAVYALANVPVAGSEMVFLNGVLQMEGEEFDYEISGHEITFDEAPLTEDRILVSYIYGADVV